MDGNNLNNLWELTEQELAAARQARSAGNEGKARVCARRAAGKGIKAAGISSGPPLAAIRLWMESTSLPDEIRSACANLLLKVNDSYSLADSIDLIADAGLIIQYLRANSTDAKLG
jgi:hypothetical protein